MRLSTIYLPEPFYEMLEDLVRDGQFPNRAEAIREAIRMLLREHGKFAEWLAEKRKQDEILNDIMERHGKSEGKRLG